MKNILKKLIGAGVLAFVASGIVGCATQANSADGGKPVAAKKVVEPIGTTAQYFLVYPKDGRLWAFGDAKNYLDYMAHGEIALTRSRIGGGPQGQTIVFGITGGEAKDVKKLSVAEQIFEGYLVGGTDFYGEIVKNGRYHVFGEWQDFKDYLTHGEMIYTFAEIGTGPKGESVIYALNKVTTKQGRPVKLIEKFNSLRGKK